jgi:hypothetical protein
VYKLRPKPFRSNTLEYDLNILHQILMLMPVRTTHTMLVPLSNTPQSPKPLAQMLLCHAAKVQLPQSCSLVSAAPLTLPSRKLGMSNMPIDPLQTHSYLPKHNSYKMRIQLQRSYALNCVTCTPNSMLLNMNMTLASFIWK